MFDVPPCFRFMSPSTSCSLTNWPPLFSNDLSPQQEWKNWQNKGNCFVKCQNKGNIFFCKILFKCKFKFSSSTLIVIIRSPVRLPWSCSGQSPDGGKHTLILYFVQWTRLLSKRFANWSWSRWYSLHDVWSRKNLKLFWTPFHSQRSHRNQGASKLLCRWMSV